MFSKKLLKILQNLTAWETRNFQQYLSADFFNHRTDVVQLLDIILGQENGRIANLSKEALFQKIYPNKPFDAAELYRLNNRLFKLAEQFLALRIALDDPFQQDINLAKAYRQLNQENAFQKTIQRTHKKLEKQPIRNAEYLRYQYDLVYESYDYVGSKIRASDTNLQEVGDRLDAYFIASKLQQGCLKESHQAVYKKEYQDELLVQVVQYVEQNPATFDNPAIAIYYTIYKGITEAQQAGYFPKLRALLMQHHHAFLPTEIRDFYLLVINYCIRKSNTGEPFFIQECFELYNSGLKQGFLLENGIVSKFTFTNAIAFALRLKKYDWVEIFIKNYQEKLPPNQRKSTVLFNLARLRHQEGKYPEAMQLLAQFQSEDYINHLIARTMLLKMYYELGEWDALESLLYSMQKYLRRKEVLNYHRAHFQHIISFTKKLVDLPPNDTAAKNALKAEIKQAKFQSEKDWFLERLNEL